MAMEGQPRPVYRRKLRTEAEPAARETEKLVLYDQEHDCWVVRHVPRSSATIPVFGFDLDDIVRTPILQILRAQEQDRDPRTGQYCILGKREQCTLYDALVKESRRFTSKVPKKDQARYLNAPERVLLSAYPPFCEACTWVEHARRKKDRTRLRRFIRWLRPSS